MSQILAFSLMIYSLVNRDRLCFVHLLRVPRLSEFVPLLSSGVLLSIRTISAFAAIAYATLTSAVALASLLGYIAISGVKACGGGAVGVWCGMNFLMIARAIVLFWRYLGSSSPLRVSEGE